jgi:alpha-ketoglutarate-dependent taurine dioxygenase
MREARETSWAGPLVVRHEHQTLADVLADRRDWIEHGLLEHGAILFRGFNVDSKASFRSLSELACDRLIDYVYRSTPRTAVDQAIYTATEYRSDATIPLHNENAFQRDWPMRLLFGCLQPARSGGETVLARTGDVTARIDRDVIERFSGLGVTYVRNYGQGVDLSWETTFQTSVPAEVEDYCRREGIRCEWLPNDCLRTAQTCHATANHPITGEELWFNQAHLFHVSSLGPEDERAVRSLFEESELPRNAYFGDGSDIPREMLAHIRAAYDAASYPLTWEHGDLLLVDNMLVAHGRLPFVGSRQLLVAMGDLFSECCARREARLQVSARR